MMNYTHTAAALATALAVYPIIENVNASIVDELAFGCGCLLGGLIPDIDTIHSKLGRTFVLILWPVYFLQLLFKVLYEPVYKVIRHKGILHWPLFWVLLITVFVILSPNWLVRYFVIGLGGGSLSHLLMDYIAEGIYALAPFSFKKYSLSKCMIVSGGILEMGVFVVLVLFDFCCIRNMLY